MLAGVSGRTATAEIAGQTSRKIRRLGWPAAAVAGTVVVFLCALREARVEVTQSDGASIVLQASAMLHGNLLLHGWYIADVSFYTTELPEYMLVELVRGMRPDVVAICSALTYTLLVVLAAFVARGTATGRTGIVRVAIAVAIMAGPSLAAANVLLNDPDHTGTAVPVLAAFALIDRGGRRRLVSANRQDWLVPAGTWLVLTLALVGDPLALVIGVIPVLMVTGPRACYKLIQRRLPLGAAAYELSLAAAALLAVLAARAITHLIRASGGFVLDPGAKGFVLSSTMTRNVWATVENFLAVFSADFFGQRFGPGLIFIAIHLLAAGLVVTALWLTLRRFFTGRDLVAALLAAAICADLLAYSVVYRVSGATIREMAPIFALGAALAGRVLAEPLLRNRMEPLLAAGMVCALWAMAPAVLLAGPPRQPPVASLATWLEQHDLHDGIAGYWQANSVTLDSASRVTMRSVREYPSPGRGLAPYPWELDVALLDSRTHYVNFLVATAPGTQAGSTVTEQEGIARFGKPYRVFRYEQYVIMIWRKNLLTELVRQ